MREICVCAVTRSRTHPRVGRLTVDERAIVMPEAIPHGSPLRKSRALNIPLVDTLGVHVSEADVVFLTAARMQVFGHL